MKKITLCLCLALSYFMMGQPTSTPPAPTAASADVVSLFSDAYTSTATLNLASFTPAGNTATIVSAAGNDVYEFVITGGEFHGFDLSNAIDLTPMENLHYDVWVEGTIQPGAIFNTTVSYHAGGHLSGQTTGYVDTNAAFSAGDEGMWLSFDIPFSDFAPDMSVNPRDIISQIVFTHTNLSDSGPIYIDNVYFWKTATDPNADATLSDLTLDGTTITGFAPGTLNYTEELPNGTTTAPTVAGVATEAGNGATVSVTQASGVPGSATLVVTAPNGMDMQTYTVNFTEAPALPPAAPTPPSAPALSILSDVYADITVPQVDVFGGTLTNFDLNSDSDEEARLLNGGSGFQFNFFPGNAFVDISAPAMMHFDFYCDNIADGDVLRVRLLGSDTSITNIARATFNAAQSGSWVSVDLMIPDGTNRNDFSDIDSSAGSIDVTDLALIQFNTLDLGSTLDGKDVYLSNIYFYGGTLSTSDFTSSEFKVFPNPSNNQWNILSSSSIKDVAVYDILGKQVISLTPNTNEAVIDASSLKTGVYIARIEGENGTKTLRLVKQ